MKIPSANIKPPETDHAYTQNGCWEVPEVMQVVKQILWIKRH